MEYRLRIWPCVAAIWVLILAYHILLAQHPSVVAVYRDNVYHMVRYCAEWAQQIVARTVEGFVWGWGVFEARGKQYAKWAQHTVLKMAKYMKGYLTGVP